MSINPFKYVRWMQGRLVVHGFNISVDGVVGAQTTGALRDFQRAKGLPQTGTCTAATEDALRLDPAGLSDGPAVTAPDEVMPPWMLEMYRRYGLHEVRDNATLSSWLKFGKWLGDPAKYPWCGDAIETCILRTVPGEPIPNSPFWAQSWKDFGIDAGGPIVGAISVIRWSPSSGHVGITAEVTPTHIVMIGGNQSDSIRLTSFRRSSTNFIAHRWPKNFPIKRYPALTAKDVQSGSFAGTR